MDDIQELCPRVLVIDHGRLTFDGALAQLAAAAAPNKLVSAVFSEPSAAQAAADTLSGFPRRDTGDPLKLSVSVPRERVPEIASRLLAAGHLADLGIEDVPVEEIIRGLFAHAADHSPDAPNSRDGQNAAYRAPEVIR
jgi:ABC-2 type transport system ATP-binding protein